MKWRAITMAAVVTLSPTPSFPSSTGRALLAFDDTASARPTWGRGDKDHAIVTATGPGMTTDGGGALHLSAKAAPDIRGKSQYFGAMIPLAKPEDLTAERLLVDARTTHPETTAFYVRVYNAGEERPAWSFQSRGQLRQEWRTFEIQAGVSSDGLLWEPKVVEDRVAKNADRIEFVVGTQSPGAGIDLLVDNLRLAPARTTIENLSRPATRLPDTRLVIAGKPNAIVLHPDSDAGREAAARIVGAIRDRTGAQIPARPGSASDHQPRQNAILLGNVHTNPALLLLYARNFTPADAICPGAGGSLIHTAHDPFGLGANAIIVAASDDAGIAKAADALATLMSRQPRGPNLALPRIFERDYGPEFLKRIPWAGATPSDKQLPGGLARAQKALDEGRHTSVAGELANVAKRYRLTGASIEARLFVALWDMYLKSAKADPRKYGGPWGFDSDFPSGEVVSGWDLIEDDPAITDGERLRVMKAMGRWLAEAVIPKCASAATGDRVPHNHQTFPALGAMFAGLYYSKGIDTLEGQRWLAMADAIFGRQARYFKPYEDCNGYQWLTTGHLMRHAVARPDFTIFENGNGRRLVDYAIGTMNNLGYQVPYGDTGSWQCWNSEMICLDLFAFATGCPAATWAANLKREIKNTFETHAFYRQGRGRRPDHFNGVRTWPLESQYAATWPDEIRPPLQRLFDKISFREAMDPDAAYLLLDGLGNGGHKHLDANAVLQITRFGRIWLADNDYFKAQVKYHNSMMVSRDGRSAPPPPYAELLGAGESPAAGFSHTRLNNYAGADWERAIGWHKADGTFVVLDRLTAREAGDYQFRQLWHGIGKATLSPEGLHLEQKGPDLWIQIAPGPELRLADDPDLGQNWKGYPHADPVVRSLAAVATVRLKTGESYLFATAIHGTATGHTKPWEIRPLRDLDGIVAKASDGPLAIAFGPGKRPTPKGIPDSDACLMAARGDRITLLGATSARFGGKEIHRAAASACVDLDLPDASAALLGSPERPPTPNLQAATSAPPHPIVWQRNLSDLVTNHGPFQITRLAAARHAPGQTDALIATREGELFSLKADGSSRWHRPLGAQINDVATADLDGDGHDEILVARQDHFVAAHAADGRELWRRELKYYRRPPHANVIRAGDIDGDGRPEVIAGGENWRFYAFRADGTELWNYESVHPSRSGAVADLDGDGREEVICGTHYYWVSTLGSDGTRLWSHRMGPICYDIATGNFDGARTRGVVLGGGDGIAHILSHDGKPRAQFDTGDEVRRVACADLDGDGRDEALAGSMSHSLYCFNGDGALRWRQDLGAPVSALVTIPRDGRALVVAATSAGNLLTLDANGHPLAAMALGTPVTHLVTRDTHVVAAAADGRVICLIPSH